MKYQTKQKVVNAWLWDCKTSTLDDMRTHNFPYSKYHIINGTVSDLSLYIDNIEMTVQRGNYIVLYDSWWQILTTHEFFKRYEQIQ